ncbi:hydroxyisourate hydrolase [Alloalcanivorax sp. C16-2]|uniref:hydroxyisourate hydrolase n=1 Tax=Alloalcanivorax TaxID=3020832 RepID=UPI001934A63D|nr:hydroxyisourate hydrolase [Alloalcanivorax marinus]MBL7252420.1 hydroxyisourate hydrolase [Alloalcanivorax marinus]
MGRLTTHVLDTASGQPAAGLALQLWRLDDGDSPALVCQCNTDADGRCPAPLLEGEALRPGRYQLVFQAGDHFRRQGTSLPEPAFLDEVVVRFGVADAQRHYHVPLLLSPYGYSTYRGS